MIDLKALSDDELRGLLSDVLAEQDRRRAAPVVEAGKAEVLQSLRDSGAVTPPPHADDAPETMEGVKQVPAGLTLARTTRRCTYMVMWCRTVVACGALR